MFKLVESDLCLPKVELSRMGLSLVLMVKVWTSRLEEEEPRISEEQIF